MSNLYHTTIESVQHLNTLDAERPILAAAALAVAGAGYCAKRYHTSTHPKGAQDARGIQQQIQASRIGTEANTDKMLFSPVKQVALGLGIAALQLAQPTYEATYPDAEAEVMVVADVSSSMVYTSDLGANNTTRYGAAIEGLKESDFQGSLGFIQTAGSTQIMSKPITDWRAQVASIELPKVDPNGGSFIPALEQAATLFTENPETKLRNGTIVVVSDGTVNESREQINAQADKLEEMGLTVRVVVPGSNDGEYTLPQTTQQTKAGIKPDSFAAFGDSVTRADTVEEVKEAVSEDITAAGTRREKEDWPVPVLLGGAIALVGAGRALKRVITKY